MPIMNKANIIQSYAFTGRRVTIMNIDKGEEEENDILNHDRITNYSATEFSIYSAVFVLLKHSEFSYRAYRKVYK